MDRRFLQWHAEHLPEVEAALSRGDAVEIALPAGTHHALYMHMRPAAVPGEGASFEATGGAELLDALAGVAGLEDLARFVEPLARAGYSVMVSSPDPTLVLLPPEHHPLWISVEWRKGRSGEPEPCEFRLGGRRLHVIRVVERGGDAHRRTFTVAVADGRRFVLEHDRVRDSWHLQRVMAGAADNRRAGVRTIS
jgi:hypothetical protein